jgi:hypothetical protein
VVAIIFSRPVACRANFSAASFASVPELQSQTLSTSTGATSASRSYSAVRAACGYDAWTYMRSSSWLVAASTTSGWQWPTGVQA